MTLVFNPVLGHFRAIILCGTWAEDYWLVSMRIEFSCALFVHMDLGKIRLGYGSVLGFLVKGQYRYS